MNNVLFKSLSIILALLASMAISSCGHADNAGQQVQMAAVPVSPYIVPEKKVSYYDAYPATVSALEEVALRSEVSGYITGIFFKEGRHVDKGSKLYEIDRRKYMASREQAGAGVAIAEANLEKAKRDVTRYTSLSEQKAIATQTLEDANTSLENAKTQVKAAKAELLRAETDLNYSEIKAPFSGTIGFSQVKTGTFVVAGQTILTTLSSENPAGVDFTVDASYLPYFRVLENSPRVNDSTFLLIASNGVTYPFPGRLTVIDRAVDPTTGTLRIRLVFPNNSGILKSGMNVRVKVLNNESGSQIVIPTKALNEQMSEYFVYEIHDSIVKQTRVEPGLNLGEFIVIRSGIQSGDTIVADGLKNLRDGSKIRFANPSEQGGNSR